MKRFIRGVAVGVATCACSMAIAGNLEEVTVVGSRSLAAEKVLSRSPGGATKREISVSYGVSYAGLDLGTTAGATELEKRVREAAHAACADISQQRPLLDLSPDETGCAKAAAEKAMVRVHELVAAAGRKPAA